MTYVNKSIIMIVVEENINSDTHSQLFLPLKV